MTMSCSVKVPWQTWMDSPVAFCAMTLLMAWVTVASGVVVVQPSAVSEPAGDT